MKIEWSDDQGSLAIDLVDQWVASFGADSKALTITTFSPVALDRYSRSVAGATPQYVAVSPRSAARARTTRSSVIVYDPPPTANMTGSETLMSSFRWIANELALFSHAKPGSVDRVSEPSIGSHRPSRS